MNCGGVVNRGCRMTSEVDVREVWPRLLAAHDRYTTTVSPHYDEVVDQVVARVGVTGSIGKAEIGALLFWKRLRADVRWASNLHAMPDDEVRRVTSRAVTAVRDTEAPVWEAASARRAALWELPGFGRGDALASALLCAAAPDRMAVYDRRVHAGIEQLGLTLTNRPGRYGGYLRLIYGLLTNRPEHADSWAPRQLDLALYNLGRLSR